MIYTTKTVTEELESYLTSVCNKLKPTTHGIYQRYIESYIAPYFENTICDKLTQGMIQSFVDRLLENGLAVIALPHVIKTK